VASWCCIKWHSSTFTTSGHCQMTLRTQRVGLQHWYIQRCQFNCWKLILSMPNPNSNADIFFGISNTRLTSVILFRNTAITEATINHSYVIFVSSWIPSKAKTTGHWPTTNRAWQQCCSDWYEYLKTRTRLVSICSITIVTPSELVSPRLMEWLGL